MELAVSTRSAWQRFHGCTTDYIASTCFGRCCDAPSRPGGTLVTIHTSEQAAIEAAGGSVRDGLLVTDGTCTFKTDAHLCGLHGGCKPFGCIASPFTLAPGGRTLVIRNRYRALVCYEATSARRGVDTSSFPPAFIAFRASLDLICGHDAARILVDRLLFHGDARAPGYAGPAAVPAHVPDEQYAILATGDNAKRAAQKKT